ncbi:MAG: GTPase [Flavobacteriaceae bacterium]
MEKKAPDKIVFVYNADSGKRNAILDSLHKVLQPSTYDCNLCDITFGILHEKKEWKEFRTTYEGDMEFLHKDEFQKAYASKFGHRFSFPIVLVAVSGTLEVLIGTEELNALPEANSLIDLIKARVELD